MTRTTTGTDAAERYWGRVVPTLVRADEWPVGTTGTGRLRMSRPLTDEAGRIQAVTRGDPLLLHVLTTAALTVAFAASHGRSKVVVGVPGPTERVVLPISLDVSRNTSGGAHCDADRRCHDSWLPGR